MYIVHTCNSVSLTANSAAICQAERVRSLCIGQSRHFRQMVGIGAANKNTGAEVQMLATPLT